MFHVMTALCFFGVCSIVQLLLVFVFFFFKQKTAYEMRISDWSSDVCSSDLRNSGASGVPQRRLPWPTGPPSRDTPVTGTTLAIRDGNHASAARQSVVTGKSVSVRVDLGGRRIIKTKKID